MSQKIDRRSSTANSHVSGWASALALFAACLMMLAGVFGVIAGLAAVLGDSVYAVRGDHIFEWDLTVWGWIHIVLGLLVGLAGFALYHGWMWVRPIGMALVIASAIANFTFLPYYPAWSLLIIVLDIVAIGALAAYGRWATATSK